MTWYIVNTKAKYCEHEGNEASCREWLRNVTSLFGKTHYVIVQGAKARNLACK